MARRDAGRIRIQRQGAAVRDQPQEPRVGRIEHRAIPRSGVLELGNKLGAINWQLAPEKQFDAKDVAEFLALLPREIEGHTLRHALEARHESFDCEEFVALARKHQVAVVEAGDSEYPRIEARTAPFSYLRVMGAKADKPKGYTPAALKRWREHAQALARDGDVYFYFISGAKERNPHAARALIADLAPD